MMRDRSSSVNPTRDEQAGHDRDPAGRHPDRACDDQAGGQPTVLFDVWLVARSVTALLDDALAGTGLGAEDFAVYSLLAGRDGVSPTEMALWMSAPATTVSSQIKRLHARGHVERVPHPGDGRSYRLRLTPAGWDAWAAAGQRFLPASQRVERALATPAARVQDTLRELRDAVEAVRREEDQAGSRSST